MRQHTLVCTPAKQMGGYSLRIRVSRLFTEVDWFPGTGNPSVLAWILRWTECLQRSLLFGRLMAARPDPFFPGGTLNSFQAIRIFCAKAFLWIYEAARALSPQTFLCQKPSRRTPGFSFVREEPPKAQNLAPDAQNPRDIRCFGLNPGLSKQ